ncbi:alpha/beta hydrolase [Gillisia limnaea]|uniref:Phospholipase/Carboxylesterase n=1 Tax=Gillisia limnaea (strain DSM 15749 / LMG 21470 / R-8282) TaxID=865937 RepID=H2BZV1_GILLR|nr:esterase [Gillisia limnaea]EHQ01293.1 phospholipase/Carboxylesterase [Gillisia limnaea DSM 15749]
MEKKLSYQISNSYSTLNKFTSKTKNVWVVFHGIGYLSRYFLKYFKELDPEENYIIAPQAQSKYYLNDEYRHVGASWLTKENTEADIENLLGYLEAVYTAEALQNAPNLILMGYSQGVSVATRWVARNKIECSQLILCSGGLPVELETEDFEFLTNTKVTMIYGTKDEYLNEERLKKEHAKAKGLFGEKLEIISFEGGHEVNVELIPKFA